MKCDSCKNQILSRPTQDDPLAGPYCSKGHWEGLGDLIQNDQDYDSFWDDCKNFEIDLITVDISA